MSSIAIYIHIPWCASICPYCDFDKQASDFRLIDPYVDALCRHLEVEPRRPAHSVFFGGGTPSLLTPARLGRIVDACGTHMEALPNWEVTVEANPSDVVEHKIAAYLAAGVTRLSIGIQSMDDEELRFLGRRHSADKAARAIAAARSAGCADISADLMYGLPMSSVGSVQRSLEQIIALEPDHVSCYALTLEDTTPMGRDLEAGRILLPEDDAVADQYAVIQEMLATSGFEQYELSNWARPGHASHHNLTYWRAGEYLGLGAGASGSIAGLRYKRTPVVRDYIAEAIAGRPAYVEEEPWTRPTKMRDAVMLGLRLAEGVSDRTFATAFGASLREYCGDALDGLVARGVLRWTDDRLSLARDSYFVCNAVLAEILP